MGPAITLKQFSLTMGDNTLLKPFDLTLAAGKLHLLTGPNGAGKSSLLKSILGLMPHSGEVTLHWPSVPEEKESNAGLIIPAYIPQLATFDATLPMTIEDYLYASTQSRAFFRKKTPAQQLQLNQLMQQVGLADKAQRKLGQLSGGERQRLLFARALAQNSSFWLLDEPMTGLDQQAQQQIESMILRLKKHGCTLIMVHHDHDFVLRHADNVVVINGGLEAWGSPEKIYGLPRITVDLSAPTYSAIEPSATTRAASVQQPISQQSTAAEGAAL